ncbi:hypothetical protein B9Z65_4312 [Elsinoe australis]|uniref:Uncharacterized protein n=1 Tax=Elsinoe australis TaxID=40998 RepID=A0A2P7Z2F9_9PEZI|nr:hypothetical protein B9Z65_4312 [Elsinoe australis]
MDAPSLPPSSAPYSSPSEMELWARKMLEIAIPHIKNHINDLRKNPVTPELENQLQELEGILLDVENSKAEVHNTLPAFRKAIEDHNKNVDKFLTAIHKVPGIEVPWA